MTDERSSAARRRFIALLMFGPLIGLALGVVLHVAAGYVFDMYSAASADSNASTSQGMASGIESSKGDVSFARDMTKTIARGLIYIDAALILPCFVYSVVLYRRDRRGDQAPNRGDLPAHHSAYADMVTKNDSRHL